MLRFQILLVSLCIAAIPIYGFCLPFLLAAETVDDPTPYPALPVLRPGSAVRWEITFNDDSRLHDNESLIRPDGTLCLAVRPGTRAGKLPDLLLYQLAELNVRVDGLTPIAAENAAHKALTFLNELDRLLYASPPPKAVRVRITLKSHREAPWPRELDGFATMF
jgi:hypothetical protein